MTGYGDGAPIYRAARWRGVLPLPPNKKSPPPVGFTGWLGAWPTDEQIEAWRIGRATATCRCGCNPGMFGLDVDAYDTKTGGRTLNDQRADTFQAAR